MAYITGRRSYLAIGSQSAPGAAATPTISLALTGDSGLNITRETNFTVQTEGQQYDPVNYWYSGKWGEGRIEARLHPAYDGSLISWILQRDSNGETPYFTIDQCLGSVVQYRFVDCKINTATITINSGEQATIGMDIVAKNGTSISATAGPAVGTTLPWTGVEASITIGGTSYSSVCRSVEFTINNNVAAPRDMLRFNSITPISLPAGGREITGRISLDLKTADAKEANVDTTALLRSICSGPVEGTVVVTLTKGSLTRSYTFPRAVLHTATGLEVPGSPTALKAIEITFNALSPNGATAALTVT